jgi:hypothetical protein
MTGARPWLGAPQLYQHHRQELGYSSEQIAAGMRRLFIDGLHYEAAV